VAVGIAVTVGVMEGSGDEEGARVVRGEGEGKRDAVAVDDGCRTELQAINTMASVIKLKC